MATFILIHGAWHGGWCWTKVVDLLEAEGHAAIAPDLPAHGEDRTPAGSVTLEAYTARICDLIDGRSGPVILAGHSMAGAVIGEAAEQRPGRAAALVYVCAYIPRNGESLAALARRDTGSAAPPNIIRSEDRTTITVRDQAIEKLFYGRADPAEAKWAKSRLVPEPAAPWRAPAAISAESCGRVPRYYVECRADRAISPAFQREMYTTVPCARVYSLDADHSPFLSNARGLAAVLMNVAATKKA